MSKKIEILALLSFMLWGCSVAGKSLPMPGEIRTPGGTAHIQRNSIVVRFDKNSDPAIRLLPPAGQECWDMSDAAFFAVDVTNLSGSRQVQFMLTLKTAKDSLKSGIALNPGETRTLRFGLPHQRYYQGPQEISHLQTIDTAKVTSIDLGGRPWFAKAEQGLARVRLSYPRLEGNPEESERLPWEMIREYLPFIDKYGQFIHADWPEKIRSDADLKAEFERENAELAASPRPEEWNEFGGWKNGPQLEATGYFRTEKYQGKWYFVDPSGRLFFSHGLDVLYAATDPVKVPGHEKWFAADLKGKKSWNPTHDSLRIKYGREDYAPMFFDTLSKRLEHWGLNTIGNWADNRLILSGKTPYVYQITDFDHRMPKLGRKFYDVYDPVYRERTKNRLKELVRQNETANKTLTDPMCIGYFIDNEPWFDCDPKDFKFMSSIMKSNADKPAKMAFVAGIREKYKTVEAANKEWNTSYADWDSLLKSSEIPSGSAFRADMEAFLWQTVEEYFRLNREMVKSVAPHRLYLGCRFIAWEVIHPRLLEISAKYSDVLSFNIYAYTPGNFPMTNLPDMPVISGENHLGTCLPGRGMFSANLIAGANEKDRAKAYIRYMQGALLHPNIIGTHWFQFRDQPLTGRWDGEGFQIGFVDIADTPYRELTEAAREVGENMYRYRINGKYANDMKHE